MYTDVALKSVLKGINDKTLSKKRQADLDEQLRFADIANDESDFGLSLQLGLNMFSFSVCDNQVAHEAARLLDVAYMLLGRSTFRHILKAHMEHKFSSKKGFPEDRLAP